MTEYAVFNRGDYAKKYNLKNWVFEKRIIVVRVNGIVLTCARLVVRPMPNIAALPLIVHLTPAYHSAEQAIADAELFIDKYLMGDYRTGFDSLGRKYTYALERDVKPYLADMEEKRNA